MINRITKIVIFFLLLSNQVVAESQSKLRDSISDVNANVLFMRHALAPGFGDPINFSINSFSYRIFTLCSETNSSKNL